MFELLNDLKLGLLEVSCLAWTGRPCMCYLLMVSFSLVFNMTTVADNTPLS